MPTLPTNAAERKAAPMATGLLYYFPKALAAVAHLSKVGNDQHNSGQPLHWAREKSTDHADCIVRHLVDAGSLDTDGVLHSAKVAWRALALLEVELEATERRPLIAGPLWAPGMVHVLPPDSDARKVYDKWQCEQEKHAPKEHRRMATDAELRAAGLEHLALDDPS